MRNISVFQHSTIDFSILPHIIVITVPDTPLNDAYHVGSLNFRKKYGARKKQQAAITIDEQIENLNSMELTIDDEEYARRFLPDKTVPI